MIEKVWIHEKALLYRIECPLRSNGSSTVPESPVLACAQNTARRLMAELIKGRVPSAGETREFFDFEWQQTAYFKARSSLSQKEYERRVKATLKSPRKMGTRRAAWRFGKTSGGFYVACVEVGRTS